MAQTELVLDTCLTAGRIMIENGSEISRVEDTMTRIAKNAGLSAANHYVTVTGVMMSVRGQNATQIEPITQRTIDLEKVAAVNRLSRKFAKRELNLPQLHESLLKLDQLKASFPLWLQLIGAGLVSGPLMIVFRHTLVDTLPTLIIGVLGYLVFYLRRL